MRSLYFITILLFTSLTLSAQQIDTMSRELDVAHPGTLLTITEDFPNSPIDGYNLYIPKSSKESRSKYPVLVFLQGGLGVGGSVDKILRWGLPKAIVESTSLETEIDRYVRDTFVVVMPHISGGEFYEGEKALRTIINRLIENENVDPKKIYVTGLSRGGTGTWGLLTRMNDVFAAAVPICGRGGGIREYNGPEDFPVWISHNTGDGVVPYTSSERIVKRIEESSNMKFYTSSSVEETDYKKHRQIFTSTKSESHDAWTEMYSNPKFYKWLLRFSK